MTAARRNPHHRVGLLGMHPVGYGRWILEGFLSVADQQPRWQMRHEPNGDPDGLRRLLRDFEPDALLCESRHPEVIDTLASWKRPVVFVAAKIRHPAAHSLHQVRADNRAVGALGFDHLRRRGFHRFLFAGSSGEAFAARRREGFIGAATEAGYEVEDLPATSGADLNAAFRELFRRDPRPVALLAAEDGLGLEIIRAAVSAEIRIPEDLAVLGVDNHALLCRISHPSLSSIDSGTERIGAVAADLLLRLLSGEPVEPAECRVQPARVVTRASTDVLSTEDPNLRRVFAHIRDLGCGDIDFNEIVKLSHMSRRGLETKYKRAFGITLGEHVTRVRVARARELLEHTDMYTPDIAAECGWPSASHMCVMFKRHTRLTPSEFRREVRSIDRPAGLDPLKTSGRGKRR